MTYLQHKAEIDEIKADKTEIQRQLEWYRTKAHALAIKVARLTK